MLENSDMKAVNTADQQAVVPNIVADRSAYEGETLRAKLTKTSWNVLRFAK